MYRFAYWLTSGSEVRIGRALTQSVTWDNHTCDVRCYSGFTVSEFVLYCIQSLKLSGSADCYAIQCKDGTELPSLTPIPFSSFQEKIMLVNRNVLRNHLHMHRSIMSGTGASEMSSYVCTKAWYSNFNYYKVEWEKTGKNGFGLYVWKVKGIFRLWFGTILGWYKRSNDHWYSCFQLFLESAQREQISGS